MEKNIESNIVLLDIVEFTSRYANDEAKHFLRTFRSIIDKAGKFLFPHGSFSDNFRHQKTGDGYYIILKTIPAVASLQFVWKLNEELNSYNSKTGCDLPLQVRCILAFGTVEKAADQLFAPVFADAKRLMDDDDFKEYQKQTGKNLVLFLTHLFKINLDDEVVSDSEFLHLHSLGWERCTVQDKHGKEHIGYIWGHLLKKK